MNRFESWPVVAFPRGPERVCLGAASWPAATLRAVCLWWFIRACDKAYENTWRLQQAWARAGWAAAFPR